MPRETYQRSDDILVSRKSDPFRRCEERYGRRCDLIWQNQSGGSWGLRLMVTMEIEVRGSESASASESRASLPSLLEFHGFSSFSARHRVSHQDCLKQRASESSEPFALFLPSSAYKEAKLDTLVLQKRLILLSMADSSAAWPVRTCFAFKYYGNPLTFDSRLRNLVYRKRF